MAADKQGSITPKDALWASVGVASLLIVCAVVLIAMGKDITQLVMIANLAAIPILTGLGAVVKQRLENVEQQVNGRMTTLIDHSINSTPIPRDKPREE